MNDLIWSIAEVCRVTGQTSRTLRHYDSIGLLKPSELRNGLRCYGQAELLRLQEILVLKELGLSLSDIRELLEEPNRKVDLFASHAIKLKQQIIRLQKMLDAVELTKIRVERREPIVIEESFDGFANDPYAEEAQQRWPDQYAESQKRVAKLSKQQQLAVMQQHTDVAVALAELFKSGAKPSEQAVQQQVAKHYDWICNFWTPSREAYVNLGRMYVADERFAKNYNKYADGLAQFVCEAIEVSGLGD